MLTEDDKRVWEFVKARTAPLGKSDPGVAVTLALAPPPSRLDLHGMTVQEAYDRSKAFLRAARDHGLTSVEIVTGRSGRIRAEFPTWMARDENARVIEPLKGGGAFRIKLPRR